ncbi:MAG: DNA polymerase III subunit epsilon [Azospirillaceae bacterium]
MREIVLDTETTGLSADNGDRLVEIGCVEIVNLMPTGTHFHRYINPERPMNPDAQAVHGLGDAFLADKPTFSEVAGDFLDFITDAPLVIHNAPFDMGFLNMELRRLGLPELPMSRAVDTVAIARRRFPGAQANLDALCRRYGIDNSDRDLHGALIDADLLARVYLELRGGRQPGLTLAADGGSARGAETGQTPVTRVDRSGRTPRVLEPSEAEAAAHAALLEKIEEPVWTR